MRNAVFVVLLAGTLCGCTWLKERWPWRQQEVPLTPPAGQAPTEGVRGAAPSPEAPTTQGAEPEPPVAARPDHAAEPPPPAPKVEPAPPPPDPAPAAGGEPEPLETGEQTELVAAPGLLINDRFVTIDEILRAIAYQLAEIPAGVSEGNFRRETAQLIQREIHRQMLEGMVLPEAEQRLADQQKLAIDREMAARLRLMIAEFGGSRKKLEDHYAQRGTSLERVLKLGRSALMVQFYLEAKFAPAIFVNRRMLVQYYEAHREEKYRQPKKVEMQIIAAPIQAFLETERPSAGDLAAAKVAARKQIEKAQKELAGGSDFGEVAKGLSKGVFASKGGVWPAMAAGSFREGKVEQVAFELP
ncbi:MAG TPA: hypothetical protein VM389_14765, partial [Phycisphaerae bacterium]|nr:hypothetical protein [Phycisphaerae bacterium]